MCDDAVGDEIVRACNFNVEGWLFAAVDNGRDFRKVYGRFRLTVAKVQKMMSVLLFFYSEWLAFTPGPSADFERVKTARKGESFDVFQQLSVDASERHVLVV